MAGQETELPDIVDDEEDVEDRKAKPKQQPKRDWDRICAYQTLKVVKIRDKTLGLVYWAFVTMVITYEVLVVLFMEGKHMQQGDGIGTVMTHVSGKAYAGDKVYDAEDLRVPVIESAGAFLLTRQIRVTQTRGTCIDWDSPKKCPCDDAAGEVCEGKYCAVSTWCPSIGDSNVKDPPASAQITVVKGIEDMMLKIMSGITFPTIRQDAFYVTGASPGATNQFANITVGALLTYADPPLSLTPEVLNSGALLGVSFFWNCDVRSDCEPKVVIKRLDTGQGFVNKRARYRIDNGVETRDALYVNGLRILIDSSGLGKRFSLVLVVVQVGSAIAILRSASILVDMIMLKAIFFKKERVGALKKCKIVETEDFSDMQDRLNLIKEAEPAGEEPRGRGVKLGLGLGGTGGLAQAVLRGRGQ